MATIDELRAKYKGSAYDSMTDLEIAAHLAQTNKRPLDAVAYDLGVQLPNDPGFVTSFKNSLGGLTQGVGQVANDIGWESNPVERYGREVQQRNPVTIMQGESDSMLQNLGTNLVEHPFNTVGQIGGQALGLMGGPAVAKMGLGAYRAARGIQAVNAGETALGTLGASTYYGLPSYGQIRDTQEAAGQNTGADIARAGVAALGVGAIESRFGPEAWLGRGALPEAGKNFVRSGLRTGAVEGAEEMVQTPIETWGSNHDVFTRDTLDQALAGGLAGFVGGAPMGMAMHPFMDSPEKRAAQLARREETDLLQTTPQRMAGFTEAYKANVPDYVAPPSNADIVSQYVNPGMGLQPQEFINQQLGIGQRNVPRNDVTAAFNEKLEVPQTVLDASGNPYVTDSVADFYEFQQFGRTSRNAPKVKQTIPNQGTSVPNQGVANAAQVQGQGQAPAQEVTWNYSDPETGELLATPDVVGAKAAKKREVYQKVAAARADGIISRDQFEELTNDIGTTNKIGQLGPKIEKVIAKAQQDFEFEQSIAELPEDLKSVRRMIASLPKQQADVLFQYSFEKKTLDEIAAETTNEKTGKPVNRSTIKRQLDAAKQQLVKVGAKYGITEQKIQELFPDESVRLAGGADIQTASIADLAQSGASMHVPGAVQQVQETPDDPRAVSEQVGDFGGQDAGDAFDEDSHLARQDGVEDVVDAPTVELSDRLVDHAGRSIQQVDVEDAAEDWNSELQEGDPTWDQLSSQQRAAYVKAYVAHMDGAISAQSFARTFGDIADERTRQLAAGRKAEEARAAAAGQTENNPRVEGAATSPAGGEVTREGGTTDQDVINADNDGVRYSKGSDTQGTDATTIRSTLKQLFLSPERFDQKVKVVQSVAEIPEDVRRSAQLQSSDSGTQAFVLPNGTAWLIADNIPQGSELAVFLHEIGVHVGMEKLLGAENFTRLAQQIAEWSARTDNSMEAKIARRAMERVENAERSAQQDGRDFEDGDFIHEMIAYFIEEAVNAGINPTAVQNIKSAGLREWFRQFMAALKVALRKIGLGRFDKLTAQNLVDLAYGAADLELSGTYHGTAADFRRFDHRYMGTGEGAQAFGWGTYLAQGYDGMVIRGRFGAKDQSVIFKDTGAVPAAAPLKSRSARRSERASQRVIESIPQGPVREAAQDTVNKAKEWVRNGFLAGVFTSDLVDSISDTLKSAKDWYEAVNNRETIRTAHEAKVDEIAQMSDALQNRFDRTWKLILDMTDSGKWGYKPTWRDIKGEPDAKMAERYNALEKDERELIDAVFRHGHETIKQMQAELDKTANELFDEKIAKVTDPKKRAKLEKEKAKFLRLNSKKLSQMEGPFAPMRRVGSHVTVARSAQYLDTEKQVKAGVPGAEERLNELRVDGKHYQVVFSDSMTAAERVAREFRNIGMNAIANAKEVVLRENTLPFQSFETLRQMAAESDKKAASQLLNMIDELYLTMLADTSARKSEMRREGISGLTPDTMFRAFLSKGMADAQYLAVLKTHKDVSQKFAAMRKEARDVSEIRGDRMDAFNELVQRYDNSFNYRPSPLISSLMNINAMWTLLTKPAYYLYNMTQPLLMTQPYLAKDFNYKDSFAALYKAYTEMFGSQKMANLEHIDIEKLPADVRNAMRQLRDMGRLDITIAQDIGSRLHGGGNKASRLAGKIQTVFRTAAQKTEMMNRVVTAAAAYRLAKSEGATEAKAIDYAAKVVDRTQGNYSNFNAPRIMNASNTLKLITQFRKFQLIQATYLARLVHESFKADTPTARAAARRALGFVMMHHGILAGGLGLPLMNVVAMVFAATGDDDEPRNLELALRKELGNDTLADLLLNGVPAALPMGLDVNLTGNVGMGQTFTLMPYADATLDRKGADAVATSLMGPTMGLFRDAMTGAGKIVDGDFYGGLTHLLPSGIKAPMKSLGEAVNGVENTRGDTLVTPEEISLMATTMKALGFKSQDDYVRNLVRGQKYEFEQFFNDRTSQLKKEYTEAYRDGDGAAMQEIRQSWMEMQQFKRDYGFTVQPLSNLMKAPMERAKRERETIGGVQTTKANRQFVEQALGTN